jgi:hypothetical protein
LTEHWDGTAWSVVASPNQGTSDNRLQGVTCVSSHPCWAAGNYVNGSNLNQTLTERWDGTAWSIVPSPNVKTNGKDNPNILQGVTCVAGGDCWAVGYHFNGSLSANQTLTEHYAATTVQESSPAVSFDSWVGVIDTGASGGTYRSSGTKGATASFRFSGTGVTWITRKGPDQGIATVTLDGVSKGTFDLYGATAQDQVFESFSGLTSVTHKIVINVTGTKNTASTGTGVAVDAFVVGSTTTQDSSPKVRYDTWAGATSASASGGTYRVSGTANATCGLTFSGTTVEWITATGPAYGEAEVIIDGVNKGTVDLYSPSVHWQVAETYPGLASGSHTIVVKVLGIKNSSSTGTKVVVDAFVIF